MYILFWYNLGALVEVDSNAKLTFQLIIKSNYIISKQNYVVSLTKNKVNQPVFMR
jgi:hypothetical protein